MTGPELDESPDEAPGPAAGRNRAVLIAIGAVAALALAGLVVFLLTRPGGEEDTADPGVPTISGSAPPTPASVPAAPPGGVATGGASDEVSGPAGEPPAPAPPANAEVVAARTVAEDAIDAINSQNVDAMAQLACDPAAVDQPEELPGVNAELTENPEVNGDKATAQVRLSIEGGGEPTVVPLPLEKRADGTWCVP